MRIEDYTNLPPGTRIDNGVIETCPHCGKLGLAETVTGNTYFTHKQWAGLNEEGNPEMRWEMCPKKKRTFSE